MSTTEHPKHAPHENRWIDRNQQKVLWGCRLSGFEYRKALLGISKKKKKAEVTVDS
jgi:hypothetical protein